MGKTGVIGTRPLSNSNMTSRLISLLLSVLLTLGPFASSFGQTPTLGKDSQAGTCRVGGTSFGTLIAVPCPPPGQSGGGPSGVSPLNSEEQMRLGALSYQVHILGEVYHPGTYRVPVSTRLSEAVQMAGGVTERGSERRIELRRDAGEDRKVDLRSFKVLGNLDANPYLLDNNVVFVPLQGKVVRIEGTVKRPGTYELTREKTLKDVIHLAGGFTSGVGNPTPIKVIRFAHKDKEVIDVENQEEARRSFTVENADVIVVPHFLTEKKSFDFNVDRLPGDNPLFYPSFDERIFVIGGVATPGPYPYSPHYEARQYLALAGGLRPLAKPKKIRLVTSKGKVQRVNERTEINPGDTIIVPERRITPEGFTTMVVGLAASIASTVAVVFTLTR